MKIYTKTGDDGTTSLLGGSRVNKDDLRIESYGTVDELLAHLGLLSDQEVNLNKQELFRVIILKLFAINSLLACEPGNNRFNLEQVTEQDIAFLETQMDAFDAELEPLRNFILPGGHPSVSICHIARTVCRRAERKVVALSRVEEVPANIARYLNRLSDLLFVLGRMMNKELGLAEVKWQTR
jgi:cob(I)alamin adenosyltransferase